MDDPNWKEHAELWHCYVCDGHWLHWEDGKGFVGAPDECGACGSKDDTKWDYRGYHQIPSGCLFVWVWDEIWDEVEVKC